jgi:tripartite-type tricarboxylate transporter receptor subunit TctC
VDVVYDVNRGIMAPKGTPKDVLATLGKACAAAAKEAAFADAMKKQGTDVRYLDSAAYAKWLKQNDDLNRNLAKELGLMKR